MEFQFDLLWQPDSKASAKALAETINAEPVALINPSLKESSRSLQHLYQPLTWRRLVLVYYCSLLMRQC